MSRNRFKKRPAEGRFRCHNTSPRRPQRRAPFSQYGHVGAKTEPLLTLSYGGAGLANRPGPARGAKTGSRGVVRGIVARTCAMHWEGA